MTDTHAIPQVSIKQKEEIEPKRYREREGERERERERDRQTDRQTETERYREIERQREINRETERQTETKRVTGYFLTGTARMCLHNSASSLCYEDLPSCDDHETRRLLMAVCDYASLAEVA